MSDYTQFETYFNSVEYANRQDIAAYRPQQSEDGTQAITLSKTHKSPQVEYRAGASLLKVSRGGEDKSFCGGKRGSIKGFSFASRRRMQDTVACVRKDAQLPIFLTLTYPAYFPTVQEAKRHIQLICKCIKRAFPMAGLIWKLEPQERGAPHFHIIIWGVELDKMQVWLPLEWHRIAGNGDRLHLLWHEGKLGRGNKHCAEPVYNHKGVMAYASKYLGKTFEVAGWAEQWTGRFWAVVNRSNIPFGELVKTEVSKAKALEVMRYAKTFIAKRKKGKKQSSKKYKNRNNRTIKVFCDVDQWIQKTGLTESH
jgi:hypothetical protein